MPLLWKSQRRGIRPFPPGCVGEKPQAAGDLRAGSDAGGADYVPAVESGTPSRLEADFSLLDRGPAVRPIEGRGLPRGSPRRVQEMEAAVILLGDCRAILPTLDAGSARCCVTSPPYFGLRDYGTATWEGGDI